MTRSKKRLGIDESLLNDLHAEMLGIDLDAKEKVEYDLTWEPDLNPAQRQCFRCRKKFVLAYGERGSGKTIGMCHLVVHHLINNRDALAVLIVRVRTMATQGGLWDKMSQEILPRWKNGMGLEYTEEKMDESHLRYRYVKNKFGGWSKMILISIESPDQVKARIRGFEPSIIFIDELTTMKDAAFFTAVSQQLGRRPRIDWEQQYLAATNPEGPSHWVHKQWFEFPEGTKKNRELYASFHIPISENKHNLPPGYYDGVMEACASDPIEYRRMVLGEWVDRPTGTAMYRDSFRESMHVKGTRVERIAPDPEYPCILGYDLGTANSAIVFMQQLPFKDRILWSIFDEMVYLNRKISMEALVPHIMARMNIWQDVMGMELDWEHISDDSAMNQYRPGTGSFDCMEVEKWSREYHKTRFPNIPPIIMVPAPKFAGSVERRGRLVNTLFLRNEIQISAACVEVIEMICNLEGEDGNFFQRKHNRYSHVMDALTYPMMKYSVQGGVAQKKSKQLVRMIK